MKKESLLSRFIKIINSCYKGDTLTRQGLHKTLGINPRSSNYGTTIDNYRRMFAILGVLGFTETVGEYTVMYHVNANMSLKTIKEMAYSDSWKSWFMSPELIMDAPERKTK